MSRSATIDWPWTWPPGAIAASPAGGPGPAATTNATTAGVHAQRCLARAQPARRGAHGTICQGNIIEWSSWVRLWQWATYAPTNVLNRR
jgi:hypothetical protein